MDRPRFGRMRLAHLTVLAWIGAFAASTAHVGLPTRRSNVLAWCLLLVLAIGVRAPRQTLRSLATTWAPLVAALLAYDVLRGRSDGPDAVAAHAWPQLPVDEWLGAGQVLSVRMQHAFHEPGVVHWYDYAAWAVYVSHFLVPLLLAVLLWAIGAPQFRRYLGALTLLSWLALLTYWLYPAQPPWMTDTLPGNEHVARLMHGMWQEVGIDRAARVWAPGVGPATGDDHANPVAALPSLHAAFPMLTYFVLRGGFRRLDAVLLAYAAAMAVTLVYAGEHFALDIALGWTYAWFAAVAVAVARARIAILDERPLMRPLGSPGV